MEEKQAVPPYVESHKIQLSQIQSLIQAKSGEQNRQDIEHSLMQIFRNLQTSSLKRILSLFVEESKSIVVHPGLSLLGKCSNKDCRAFGRPVWISKGFGFFEISKERYNNKCATCKSKIRGSSISGIGFLKARVQIQGNHKIGGDDVDYRNRVREQLGSFQLWKDYHSEWHYLNMRVTAL